MQCMHASTKSMHMYFMYAFKKHRDNIIRPKTEYIYTTYTLCGGERKRGKNISSSLKTNINSYEMNERTSDPCSKFSFFYLRTKEKTNNQTNQIAIPNPSETKMLFKQQQQQYSRIPFCVLFLIYMRRRLCRPVCRRVLPLPLLLCCVAAAYIIIICYLVLPSIRE